MKFDKNILYDISYKTKYDNVNELNQKQYDLFISAFNDSERVKDIFNYVNAQRKYWIVFNEYNYCEDEMPEGDIDKNIFVFNAGDGNEAEIIRELFSFINIKELNEIKICIDITGFIRPHLIFLIRYLHTKKIINFDCIYTDPIKYKQSEDTSFSDGFVSIRQVIGFQGLHQSDNNNDYLLIASGYDNMRISNVAMNKDNTKKIQLFGFPSLQPDMYQQNILKAYKASEEIKQSSDNSFLDELYTIYAPANDPFVTAKAISDFFKDITRKENITNLYMSPLSTKVQTLGMALFYIAECIEQEVSIIFPFCNNYSKETTEGISKIWIYTIDFDIIK